MSRTYLRHIFLPATPLLVVLFAGCGSSSSSTTPPEGAAGSGGQAGFGGAGGDAGPADGGDAGPEPESLLSPKTSCALDCDPKCEPKGYECAALAPWDSIPHAASCGNFTGKFPSVTGKCTASAPAGEAVKRTGVDPGDPLTTILPTGQRARAAGKSSIFTDYFGQFPTNVVAVPGSDLVVVADGGIQDHSVRLVDTSLIGGIGDPVVGRVPFRGATSINYGVVVVPQGADKARAYVSGGYDSIVYAFSIDVAGKKLDRDAASDIKIVRPPERPNGGGKDNNYMLSGLATSPDGKRLFIGTQNAPAGKTPLVVVDIDPESPTFKKVYNWVDILSREIFTVMIHPADTKGDWAYVSAWDGNRVDVVNAGEKDPAKGVLRTFKTGKAPEAFAPLGTRYLAVVSADGDTVDVLDTLPTGGGTVLSESLGAQHGASPSGVAFDLDKKRLYVTLAGRNAVAAYDVGLVDDKPPTLTYAGSIPTEWWPTGVSIRDDHSLVIVNGKGRGTGANPTPWKPSEGDITNKMRGSIQLVPYPSADDLRAGQTAVDRNNDVGALAGRPTVDCGPSAYDFPIPAKTTDGPSKQIKHVIFVVKENKTFDAVFGDMPGVDGDPKLIMAPKKMDSVFANQRMIAKTFTNFDNFYTSAEQSLQGHIWTAYGRTTEFTERTWEVTWGRGVRGAVPPQGLRTETSPFEGSVFNWLARESVAFDDMGEVIGSPAAAGGGAKAKLDTQYPGLVYAQRTPDTMKSCYIIARARATCDLNPFTYAVQPNDHTSGYTALGPTPEAYIAVGDEGLGLLLDGLSRSPIWGDTLVMVTMDDPQDGGDHVDAHRTLLLMAGPWVKRGYVSKGHYDISSVHKLLAHIYGKPYISEIVAKAALPLDAFTSTPDFTPYDRVIRTAPLACNPMGTKGATTAAMSGWRFDIPDQAPGVGRQVWEYFHDGEPPPASAVGDDDD